MGTMGLPLSVLRSMPVPVCTSNMGLRVLKKAGLPQPALHHTISCSVTQSELPVSPAAQEYQAAACAARLLGDLIYNLYPVGQPDI